MVQCSPDRQIKTEHLFPYGHVQVIFSIAACRRSKNRVDSIGLAIGYVHRMWHTSSGVEETAIGRRGNGRRTRTATNVSATGQLCVPLISETATENIMGELW